MKFSFAFSLVCLLIRFSASSSDSCKANIKKLEALTTKLKEELKTLDGNGNQSHHPSPHPNPAPNPAPVYPNADAPQPTPVQPPPSPPPSDQQPPPSDQHPPATPPANPPSNDNSAGPTPAASKPSNNDATVERGTATATWYGDTKSIQEMTSCGSQTELGVQGPRAAVSQGIYGPDKGFSLAVCGQYCYTLTPIGSLEGNNPIPKTPITVSIQDNCPNDSNKEWCPFTLNDVSQHGYHVDFDIMAGSLVGTEWENFPYHGNLIVNYEKVPCPKSLIPDYNLFIKYAKEHNLLH